MLREGKIVHQLRRPMEAAVLARICEDDIKAAKLVHMLRNANQRSEMYDKLIEFVEKSTMVPIPPQIDHELIQPIRSIHELSRTAMHFRNCLRSCVDEALAGEVAFYRLEGEEPAVFAIEPRIGGYAITQIRGIGNSFVSPATKDLVRKAMTESGLTVLKNKSHMGNIQTSLQRLGSADDDDYRGIDAACRHYLEAEEMEIAMERF